MLHCAAEADNVEAARILLENSADIDTPDSIGLTALFYSTSAEMVKTLVRHGASLVHHFNANILTMLSLNHLEDELLASLVSGYSDTGTIPNLLQTIIDTRGAMHLRGFELSPNNLVAILEAGIDLNCDLGSGLSLMHLAICDEPSAAYVLNSNLDLNTTIPFPWHLHLDKPSYFIGTLWRYFRRKLTEEGFARLAHLQPAQGVSPLCQASGVNDLELIRNCLSLGAEVDFEGSPHGSAVIVASACGNVDAVRILVQAGASLSYTGKKGQKSVFTFCRSEAVRRWLLVDRFTEQRLIDMKPYWGDDGTLRRRAGTAVARLKLVGSRAMCHHETMIDYAERLEDMRKEWRGMVIPPICMDGYVHGS